MIDTRTEAEKAYDSLKDGSADIKPAPVDEYQDLIDRAAQLIRQAAALPSAQRAADEDDRITMAREADRLIAEEEDEDDEEEQARPVPPVPAGYPTDRSLLYTSYGDVFIAIDRRDGEIAICGHGDSDAPILSPAHTQALYRFFGEPHIRELMTYLRGVDSRATPPA